MYFNDRTAAHASAVHVGDLLYLYLHAFLYFFIFCLNARTSYFKFAFVQLISASVSCVYVELHKLMYSFT